MSDSALIRRLGGGYFGEVWLVHDRALNRLVAVKFVRPDRIHDPTNFYHEPQTLVELEHRHIVKVFEAGTLQDGRLYVSMEYLASGSVEDKYSGGVVPLGDALRLVADACYGVEHAHASGYVHRDIKPANLLLDGKGRVKVSDFGLASKTNQQGFASPVGYVAHLAPEIVAGGESSPLADVYALGVTAYRLVNGDAYLPDPSALGETLEDAIVSGRYPDRTRHRAYVPQSVRRLLSKAMAVDPGKRYKSAAELRHGIEKVIPLVSWGEVPTGAEAAWEGESDSQDWAADLLSAAGQHSFTVKRAPRGGTSSKKRVVRDCQTFSKLSDARKHAAKVLQRIGLTGH